MLEWISLRYLWIHTNTRYTVKVFHDFSLSARTRAQRPGPLLAPCVAETGGDGVAWLSGMPAQSRMAAQSVPGVSGFWGPASPQLIHPAQPRKLAEWVGTLQMCPESKESFDFKLTW